MQEITMSNPMLVILEAMDNSMDADLAAQSAMGQTLELDTDSLQQVYTEYDGSGGTLQHDLDEINYYGSMSSPTQADEDSETVWVNQFTYDNTTMQTDTQSWNSLIQPMSSILSQVMSSFSSMLAQIAQAVQSMQSALNNAMQAGA